MGNFLPAEINLHGRLYIFSLVLTSIVYLLVFDYIDQMVFRDVLLGSLGILLATSAHEKYIEKKYK